MQVKKVLQQDNRRRSVDNPGFAPIIFTDTSPIEDVVGGEVNGKPAHAAEKGKYRGNSHILVGDTGHDNIARIRMGVDDDTWFNIKPVVLTNPAQTVIEDNGNYVRWNGVGQEGKYVDIEATFTGEGVKTNIICDTVDPTKINYDNLYFSVELPVGATLEQIDSGEYAGEIKILFSGVEKCYIPKPIAWDANLQPVTVSHTIIPELATSWGTHQGIKINVTIEGHHVAPITIDPTFNFAYTDVIWIKAKDTTNWPTFDRTGTGKTWGSGGEGKQPFPEVPILVSRQNNDMEIYDPSLASGSNPWMGFLTDSNNNLFRGTQYAKNFDMYDGYLMVGNFTTDAGIFINFSEDWGSGSDRTGVFPLFTQKYNGNGIQNRNAGSGWSSDAQWANLRTPVSASNMVLAVVASTGTKYFIYMARTGVFFISRFCVQPVDLLAQYGLETTLSGMFEASDFVAPASGEVGFASENGGNIYMWEEAEWTKDVDTGTFTSQFFISGVTLNTGTNRSFGKHNGKLLAIAASGGIGQLLLVIDGDVMAAGYSGNKAFSALQTDGNAYDIACISEGGTHDFKIVDDDFLNVADWEHVCEVDNTVYVIVGTTMGLFCLDYTARDTPVYNGKLTDLEATGIFEDFDLLVSDKDIQAVDAVQTATNQYVSFATADTFFIYDIVLPPTPPYPGLTQATIIYNGITIYVPIPLRVQMAGLVTRNLNIGLDKTLETVNIAKPRELKVTIDPVHDTTFDSDMDTMFRDWGGQGLWIDLTTGINARYDGSWLVKEDTWRPGVGSGGQTKYKFTLWRPYD